MESLPDPPTAARARPSGGGRVVAVIFLAIIIAEVVAAAGSLFREITAVSIDARKRALLAPEAERIEGAVLRWRDLYRAIADQVPEDAVVAIAANLDRDGFELFFRTSVLCYPRRFVAVTRPPTPEEIAAVGRNVAAIGRPVFVADLQSGFPMPPAAERVAAGPGFTLWWLR